MQATEIALQSDLRQSSNGVRYTAFGENNLESADLDRIVQAVPATIAASLGKKAYYFVPLALMERPVESGFDPGHDSDGTYESAQSGAGQSISLAASAANGTGPSFGHDLDDTMIATTYTVELSDRAICHRNVRLARVGGGPSTNGLNPNASNTNIDGVFISTRLLADRFALAFEFFINVGHAFVDLAGIPESFANLVWSQAQANVRGETSQDAWESRAQALGAGTLSDSSPRSESKPQIDEKARNEFLEAAFSDAIAIYQLSLAIDFDYAELRERDYPLLAPQALAERLRLVAKLFPPNAGYEFAIRYRRRG